MRQKISKPKFKDGASVGEKNRKAKDYFYNRKGLSSDGVRSLKERRDGEKRGVAKKDWKKISEDEFVVVPSRYDENFKAIASVGANDFVVTGGIVGEKERVFIKKRRGTTMYADFVKAESPSPDRREVACEYFYSCGNCALLHVDYKKQLELKRKKVKDAVEPYYTKTGDVVSLGEFEYRNKAHLAFGEDYRRLTLGFFDDTDRSIIPIRKCLLHGEWFAVAADIILNWARERGFRAYNPKTGKGLLRFALLRRFEDRIMLSLVVNGGKLSGTDGLYERLKERFSEVSIYTCENKSSSAAVLSGKIRYIIGEERISGELLGVKFQLSPDSFFQVNEKVAERIYSDILDLVAKSQADSVVDCFSGIGITTALFAKSGKRVTSIEIVPSAVHDAKKIGVINGLSTSVRYLLGDVDKKLGEIENVENSIFFVDPPRRGLGEKTVLKITNFSPREIIYLSCGVEALKEDVKTFVDNGYRITSATPYDLFPETAGVETLVVFTKKELTEMPFVDLGVRLNKV